MGKKLQGGVQHLTSAALRPFLSLHAEPRGSLRGAAAEVNGCFAPLEFTSVISVLDELLARWPIPLVAGVLFYMLWVPSVLLAAWMTRFRSRMRWMPVISADAEEWKRAVGFLLVLGLPLAIGFGALFALKSVVVLVVVFALICVGLIGFMLPRLNRW